MYCGFVNRLAEPKVLRAAHLDAVQLDSCPELPSRTDLVQYTTQGLSWGYHGSKSMQCALALLADALGSDALALEWHQRFEEEVISQMRAPTSPGIVWEVEQDKIQRWLALTVNPLAATESVGHAAWLLRRRLGDDDPYVSRAMQLLMPEEIRRQDGLQGMTQEEALSLLLGLVSRRDSWADLLHELRGERQF